MAELSEEQNLQIAEARKQALAQALEAFNKLDLDGSGAIERSEIQELVRSSASGMMNGEGNNDQKINEFIETFDTDGDGAVQKQEWLDFFGRLFDSVIQTGMESQAQ